jgi:hypothetical protein
MPNTTRISTHLVIQRLDRRPDCEIDSGRLPEFSATGQYCLYVAGLCLVQWCAGPRDLEGRANAKAV